MSSNFPPLLDKIPYVDAQGTKQVIDPVKLLEVSENYVDLTGVANDYFLVSSLADQADRNSKAMQKSLDSLRSELYVKYLSDPELKQLSNGRKPSEQTINSYIENDETYKKAYKQLLNSQYRVNVLKDLKKAVEIKQSLLQTISANNRIEKKAFGNQSVLKVQQDFYDKGIDNNDL